MTVIELTGRINKAGELEVKLPAGLPTGEIRVRLEIPDTELPWEERPWTEDEIRELLTFHPATGAEIVASGVVGAWADLNITDSVAWVEEVRRKEEEQRGERTS